MFKNVWAIVLGVIAAMVVLMISEPLISTIYQLPANINWKDESAVAKMIAEMPVKAFLYLLAVHCIAAFTGGLVATIVAKRVNIRPAIITSGLLIIAAIVNFIRIPHPMWFVVVNISVYIPFAYLGFLVVRKK